MQHASPCPLGTWRISQPLGLYFKPHYESQVKIFTRLKSGCQRKKKNAAAKDPERQKLQGHETEKQGRRENWAAVAW